LSGASNRAGRLGFGWTWTWDIVLRVTEEDFQLDVDSGAIVEQYPRPKSASDDAAKIPIRTHGSLLAVGRDGYIYYFSTADAVRPQGAPIAAIEDIHGNRLTFQNGSDRLEHLVDTAGRKLRFFYDASGRVSSVDLVQGKVPSLPSRLVSYEYSSEGDLVRVTDRCGGVTEYLYLDHLLVSMRLPTGGSYHAQYDPSRRCIARWQGDGRLATTFAYDQTRRQILVTDALGYREILSLRDDGQISKEVAPDGTVTAYSYDPRGGVISVSTGGADTLLVIDVRDQEQAVTMTDSAGVTLRQTIDLTTGDRIVTDASGAAWTSKYDAKQLLLEQRSPLGAITTYEYFPDGSLRAFTEPNGNTIRVAFSDGGRSAVIHDSVGEIARQQWDEEGRLVSYAEPLMNPFRYWYDALGRVVGVTQPNDGTFEFQLDAGGEIVAITDPLGRLNSREFSPYGDILLDRSPDGREIRWEYDLLGRVVAIRNEANEEMRFEYDAKGSLILQRFFDGRTERYLYDEMDNLIAIGEADGSVTRVSLDAAGKVVRLEGTGTTETVDYDEVGRATRLSVDDVVVAVDYDPDQRVIREEQHGTVLTRDYTATGECSRLAVSGLGQRLCDYDLRGRMTKLLDFDGTEFTFTYDLSDRVTSMRVEGLEVRYDYGDIDRLVSARVLGDRELVRVSYTYDALGRVSRRQVAGRAEVQFAFDGDARLIAHRRGNTQVSHEQTPTGDLLQSASGQRVTYGPGGRIERVGAESFEYDGRGRLAVRRGASGETRFQYDGFDRLVEVRSDRQGVASYVYDAEGRRLRKLTPAGETQYVWDDDLTIAVRTAGRETESFVFVPLTEAAGWITGPDIRGVLLTDPNGYPIACVGTDGRRLDDEPDPWGKTGLSLVDADRQPLRFMGQYADPETGLHYNRHRFYDPETGRYLTPDPIGIDAGLNAYVYAADPVNTIDPLGLTITRLNPGKQPVVRKKVCDKKQKKKKRPGTPTPSACNASRGASIHNDCINMMGDVATAAGRTNVTDATQQFGGGKMNRPDLSISPNAAGAVYCEWDYSPGRRAKNHIRDICRNHPGATIYLVKLPQKSRYNNGRPGKPKPKKRGKISRDPTAKSALTEKDCGIDVIRQDMGI